jgi:hypothetical protein
MVVRGARRAPDWRRVLSVMGVVVAAAAPQAVLAQTTWTGRHERQLVDRHQLDQRRARCCGRDDAGRRRRRQPADLDHDQRRRLGEHDRRHAQSQHSDAERNQRADALYRGHQRRWHAQCRFADAERRHHRVRRDRQCDRRGGAERWLLHQLDLAPGGLALELGRRHLQHQRYADDDRRFHQRGHCECLWRVDQRYRSQQWLVLRQRYGRRHYVDLRQHWHAHDHADRQLQRRRRHHHVEQRRHQLWRHLVGREPDSIGGHDKRRGHAELERVR